MSTLEDLANVQEQIDELNRALMLAYSERDAAYAKGWADAVQRNLGLSKPSVVTSDL